MKLKHLLETVGKSNMPDKEKIRKNVLKSGNSSPIRIISAITAAVLMLVIISGGVYFGVMHAPIASACDIPQELVGISPVTSVSKPDCSSDTASVEVTTQKPLTKEQFRDVFSVSPKTDYTLIKKAGNLFTVKFKGRLYGNTVYTFNSMSEGKSIYSWAYQTDNTFGISSYTPAHETAAASDVVSVDFTHSDVENFERCFSIYPELAGTFSHYGRRWVFIPSAEFEADTTYTVTVSKNITGGKGQTLEDDFSFSFTAESDGTHTYINYSSGGGTDAFLPTQSPAALISCGQYTPESAEVDVYKLASADEFADILDRYSSLNTVSSLVERNFDKYVKCISFTHDIEISEIDYIRSAVIPYPQSFEKGYYISRIKLDNKTLYHLFQVTELSVYSVNSYGDYVFWVNSAKTGLPVSKASIDLSGVGTAVTDGNGIAELTANSDEEKALLKVAVDDEQPYIQLLLTTSATEENDLQYNYYSYICTDSGIYRPGDTVKVWGFIHPRTSDVKIPDSLELVADWSDTGIKVSPDSHGGFSAEFEISDYCAQTYGTVKLVYNDNEIKSSYFIIDDYELPTYKLTVTSDKIAYLDGEEAVFNVNAATYDGTPAANVDISVNGGTDIITTDSDGNASYRVDAEYMLNSDSPDNSSAYVKSVFFTAVAAEGISTQENANIIVFASAVTPVLTENNGSLTVGLYKIDIDKINAETYNESSIYRIIANLSDYYGEKADGKIHAELHRVTYSKEITDTTYDPVSMQAVHTYKYNKNDEIVTESELETAAGVAQLSTEYTPDDDTRYYFRIYANVEDENEICDSRYLSDSDVPLTSGYALNTDEKPHTPGDKVEITLKAPDENAHLVGNLLVTSINARILSAQVFDAAGTAYVDFTELCTPDCQVIGAYFDGKSVHETKYVYLDAQRDELSIDIKPDKDKYAPGDSVSLNISVTDADSNPVSAQLNVNVIDSALYNLINHDDDIYESVYSGRLMLSPIRVSASGFSLMRNIYADGIGGGIGEDIRSDFDVSPYFDSVTTDSAGKAAVSFTLPDSITEWTAIVRAHTDDVKVGSGTLAFNSSKDFFITTSVPSGIKISDDAVFAIKVTAPKLVGQCQFTCELLRDGKVISSKSGLAELNLTQTLNFGRLANGKYTIRISSLLNENRDIVERVFDVADSAATQNVIIKSAVENSTHLSGDFVSDVTVQLRDTEYDFYHTVLDTLIKSGSKSLESYVGKAAAESFANGLNGALAAKDVTEINRLCTRDEYDLFSKTPDAVSRLTAVCGDYIDTEMQTVYYTGILNSVPTSVNALYAYWGLAALKQPVLEDLALIRENISSLSEEERLCLALAYAYAGDLKSARQIYDERIYPALRSANGMAQYSAKTAYETELYTALSAMLAVKLKAPYAKELTKAVLVSKDESAMKNTVLTAFLYDYMPLFKGTDTVVITHPDGSKENIAFEKTGGTKIIIPYNEIADTAFSSENGECIILAYGSVPVSNVSAQYTDITENSALTADIPQTVECGKTFTVNIEGVIPDDSTDGYTLDIPLPYSIKIINANAQNGSCSISQNRNRLTVYPYSSNISVTVTAVAAMNGSYTVEPTVLKSDIKATAAATESTVITVE